MQTLILPAEKPAALDSAVALLKEGEVAPLFEKKPPTYVSKGDASIPIAISPFSGKI